MVRVADELHQRPVGIGAHHGADRRDPRDLDVVGFAVARDAGCDQTRVRRIDVGCREAESTEACVIRAAGRRARRTRGLPLEQVDDDPVVAPFVEHDPGVPGHTVQAERRAVLLR